MSNIMFAPAVHLPEKDYQLPESDILTLVFENPDTLSKEETILHVEAAQPNNFITKAQARDFTRRISYILRNVYGIGAYGPGKDVVLGVSTGQPLWASVFYGVIGAGGVFSAASPTYTPSELCRQIKHGGATLILTSKDCKAAVTKAAQECGLSLDRILVVDSLGGRRLVTDHTGKDLFGYLGPTAQLQWEAIADPVNLRATTACLLYSSGTTGVPKGVKLSHDNIAKNAYIAMCMIKDYIGRERAKDPNYVFEYRTVGHLPTAHVAGCQGYFFHPCLVGGTVYWMPKFDFSGFLQICRQYRITMFFSVPPIFLLIAQSPLVTDQFKHMKYAMAGAAPMGPDLAGRAGRKLGCNVVQTWGMSEIAGSGTIAPWDWKDPTASLSPLSPNYRLRIVDDNEKDVADGQEGEFLLQGPGVTNGYLDNAEAWAEASTPDGKWYKTGDIGLKRDGRFYIVDRKKEMIKYNALQVAPAELEALLISHRHVDDAAVIGLPHENGNELPRAYVVANPSKISETEIQDFVKEKVAPHKQLRGGVVFLDAIPKNPTGKILRRELKELAKRENARPRL